MSASVYISKNENESRAFTNHCDNHINFDTIAKICVGGQYNLKFPVAAKQNKINIKNKLDIKIPLNNKIVSPNNMIDYNELDDCFAKLIECAKKMKSNTMQTGFSMRDMIYSSSSKVIEKEKAFLGVKSKRSTKDTAKPKKIRKIKTKEEETLNNCNTQNSSNNNTGNESNSIRKVLFKII